MIRKKLALLFIILTLNCTFGNALFAQDGQTKTAEKIRIKVAKMGTGGKQVEVKLNNNTNIKGYITEIKEDHLVLIDKKTRAPASLAYNDIKKINRVYSIKKGIIITAATFGAVFLIAGICVASGHCTE